MVWKKFRHLTKIFRQLQQLISSIIKVNRNPVDISYIHLHLYNIPLKPILYYVVSSIRAFRGPVKAYIYTIMNIHNLSVIFKTARKMLSYTITQFHFKEICIKMWFLTKGPTILVIYTVLHTDNICRIIVFYANNY